MTVDPHDLGRRAAASVPRAVRRLWRDPARALATLISFSNTEEDGGRDILAAAERVQCPTLRGHLARHGEDELRHAALFRAAAEGLRARGVAPPSSSNHRYDLRRGDVEALDSHGFLSSRLLDTEGEVAYVAMLHVAESRARDLFAAHAHETGALAPDIAPVFLEILRDEKYHVAYTARLLHDWRAAGRTREVARALRRARSSRALVAWRQLGLRGAAKFGHVLLLVQYTLTVAPFALLARLRRKDSAGWAEVTDTADPLEGQA